MCSSDDSRPASSLEQPAPAEVPQEPQQSVQPEIAAEPEEPLVEAPLEQTTLLQNEEESFALAPVDASVLKGIFGRKMCLS